MRVVLDTNVLARATPGRNSAAEQVLLAVIASPHALVVSEFILGEVARVLKYERVRRIHGLPDERIDQYIAHLRSNAEIVDVPVSAVETVVLPDPEDDPIVATAVIGRANAICTWDRHLLAPAVRDYCGRFHVRVLKDVDLLMELRAQEGPENWP